MAKRPRAKPPGRSGADWIPAADFKATCLRLMDRVREGRAEYVVTKHGRPIAKLVPYDDEPQRTSLWGAMKGTVQHYERPFDPIDDQWDINRD